MAPPRSRPFVRMWRVLVLLRQQPRTLAELAEMLSVHPRTIRRDLAALKSVPLPIESRFTAPSRAGVRGGDANVWCVGEIPAWPRREPTPIADVGLLRASEPSDGAARQDLRDVRGGAAPPDDPWRVAAYFAAKARNLRALRSRARAGESATDLAEDYGVPRVWVERVCAPGFDLLSGEDPADPARFTPADLGTPTGSAT